MLLKYSNSLTRGGNCTSNLMFSISILKVNLSLPVSIVLIERALVTVSHHNVFLCNRISLIYHFVMFSSRCLKWMVHMLL